MAGVLFIGLYLTVAFLRCRYQFELEWMEGGMVDHIRWILDGNPLYVPPSIDFVPFIYTPLYFYTSAVVAKLVGVGFLAPRLVSIASSIGLFTLILLIVRRQTGHWTGAVLAAGLFAATFEISGAWFDIARVDTFFLFLLLGGVYLAGSSRSVRVQLAAGLLFALAFLTKQTALFILPLVALGTLVTWRWRGLVSVGAAGFFIGVSVLYLDFSHDGLFTYYVLDLPRAHPILPAMHRQFWLGDILRPLLPACILSVTAIVLMIKSKQEKPWLLLIFSVALILTAWLIRIRSGSYLNVLMPAYLAMSIFFGLAIETIRSSARGRLVQAAVFMLALVQFGLLADDPRSQIPGKEDTEAGERLIEAVASFDGKIFMPSHGHLPALAGKKPWAHILAVEDLIKGDKGKFGRQLNAEILDAIRGQRFDAIVLDGWWFAELTDHYRLSAMIFEDDELFWPVTGKRTRPELILTPRGNQSLRDDR